MSKFSADTFTTGDSGSADYSNAIAIAGHVISFYQAPSNGEVAFKAFLTNFQDSYQSNWNRTSVYGKMDPISMFQNTQRTISIGWDVPASSPWESTENLRKVGILTQMLYPGYDQEQNATHINNAPVFKVKFVNLITDPHTPGPGKAKDSGLVCTIDGFTNQVDHSAGFITLSEGTYDGQIFPKLIKMSCVLHILHTDSVGFNSQGTLRTKKSPYGLEAYTAIKPDAINRIKPMSPPDVTFDTPLGSMPGASALPTASKRLKAAINMKMTGEGGALDVGPGWPLQGDK